MNNSNFDDNLLSIKEFSEIVGMSIETLRHYDRKGLFKPAKHGEGTKNKYRYYSPTQITIVKMIRVLTEIGVPLEIIKDLSQTRSPEKLVKLLSRQKRIVGDELNFLQEVHSVISIFFDLLIDGFSATETEIYVAEMPEKPIILGDCNNFDGSTGFHREFMRFLKAHHEQELNLSYPIGGFFESIDVFLDQPSQPGRFFSLDPKGHEKKEAGLYLIGYTRGCYGQTNNLSKRIVAFAKENGLVFNGPVYNIYLFDEISVTNPDQYLLQVSASVRETRRVPSRRPTRRI